jgi:hypothetical protein
MYCEHSFTHDALFTTMFYLRFEAKKKKEKKNFFQSHTLYNTKMQRNKKEG